MPASRLKRWGIISLVLVLVLLVGGAVGLRSAAGYLKGRVIEALGAGSEVADIRVGWSGVIVSGLRLKAPQGWPAADSLRADRVVIAPSLRGLLSGEVRIGSIAIAKPYLSALRARDGTFRVVPTLLERPPGTGKEVAPAAVPPVSIGKITVEDGVAELFDATVAQPPLKIRLEQLQATVRDVLVPTLADKSAFELTGIVAGVRRNGRVTATGWAVGATRDSHVAITLRGADLVSLQPYLSAAGEVRVTRGFMDLDLQSDVRKNRLRAPGKVTIAQLEFAPAQGAKDTFVGVPRGAVLAFLKGKDDKIAVNFLLEGDLGNPRFSLNEAFATRMASAMAEGLGVSIRGVAEGAGALSRLGGSAVQETMKGVGVALGGLFGGPKR
jgi:hypothetical protein